MGTRATDNIKTDISNHEKSSPNSTLWNIAKWVGLGALVLIPIYLCHEQDVLSFEEADGDDIVVDTELTCAEDPTKCRETGSWFWPISIISSVALTAYKGKSIARWVKDRLTPQAGPRRVAPSRTNAKRAILFGVSQYTGNLPGMTSTLYSNNDITAMANCLFSKGWDVVPRLDLDHTAMRREFTNWLTTVQEGDECYFHFSGHGHYDPDTDTRWILPSDAQLEPTAHGLRLTNIHPVDFFQDELNRRNRSGYKIFGLDCCADRPAGTVPNVTKPQRLENTYIVGYDGQTHSSAGGDPSMPINMRTGFLTQALRDIFDDKVKDGHALFPGNLGNEVFARAKELVGFRPAHITDPRLLPGTIVGESLGQSTRTDGLRLA